MHFGPEKAGVLPNRFYNRGPVSCPPKTPWYAAGLAFACTGCGNCCTGGPGYVWISDAEVQRLAEFLKITPAQVQQQYCRRAQGKLSLRERRNAQGNYDCIFLREVPADPGGGGRVVHSRRICEVYPVRPQQCRTWPFWEGNLQSPDAWNRAAERCPGINRGSRHDRQHIESTRDARESSSG